MIIHAWYILILAQVMVALVSSKNRRHNRNSEERSTQQATRHPFRAWPLLEQPNLSSDRHRRDHLHRRRQQVFAITRKSLLKADWCKTEPFKYTVKERGCDVKTIVNRFCYGQCNSFFIPSMDRFSDGLAAFQSCSFCAPKRTSRLTVLLKCPGRPSGVKKKRIEWVRDCHCMGR